MTRLLLERRLLALWLALAMATPAWATFTTYNENLPGGPSIFFDTDVQVVVNSTQGQGWMSGGALTEQATPNMTLEVTTGTGWNGQAGQTFITYNAATLTIAAADPDWPRIDLVSVPFNSATPAVRVTSGVAYAAPVPPNIPFAGAIPDLALWYVIVPAGVTEITNALLMDKRLIVGSYPFVGLDGDVSKTQMLGPLTGPEIQLITQRGTYASPAQSQAGDVMGTLKFASTSATFTHPSDTSITGDLTTSSLGRLNFRSPEVRVTTAGDTGNRLNIAAGTLVTEVANAGTTGTTVNKIAKLTGAPSTAVIATTSDTAGVVGIVVAGAGTTGSAQIARSGIASCVFDGATTANDYVVVSTTSGGQCTDFGASPPTDGRTILGRVLSTNAAGGTYSVFVQPAISSSSGSGGNTETWGVVASDVTHAQSDTTLSNVTGMSAAICAASTEVWQIDVTLIWTAANATVDIKYGWTFPTGVTMRWGPISTAASANYFNPGGTATTLTDALLDQTETFAHATGNITSGLMLRGVVTCSSTSGTLQLQFAQNTSNASNITIKKGSLLSAKKVIP